MKKILSLILALMLLLLCLASCDSSKHEHITEDWKYNEYGHWQPITCSLNTCNLEESPISDHVDDNTDNICDICGYTQMLSTEQPTDSNTECVHTYGEWQYDETYHWCDWSCSLELCDIDTVGEHIDKDGDNVCDTCNYIILNCVHTYGEWQYNETHHWCDWSCSLNMCRIETTGEHFDEDENDVCDKCGYFPLINSNVNSGNHDVHDAFDIRISWANWLDGTIVDEGCLNFDQLAISSVHHIPLHKFSSSSELDAFKARFGEDNSFDYGYNGKSFNENTADYDDAFFDENDLFLVYVDANSGSFSFDVNNIFNDGKSFGIYVNQTNNPEDVTDDMAGWFITVAVPKSATENCTLFDAIMGFPPCIDSCDMVDAVILKDSFTFNELWLGSNNELDESKTLVIESQEALDEIFTEFKEIDFEKEMVIVYCYTTIYVREQKLEKVSFDNGILSIEFDVVEGKPGTGDATAPQTRTCVICLDKVAATEVKITYNGQ